MAVRKLTLLWKLSIQGTYNLPHATCLYHIFLQLSRRRVYAFLCSDTSGYCALFSSRSPDLVDPDTLNNLCSMKNQELNSFVSREGDASGVSSASSLLGLPFFSLFTCSWRFHLSSPSTHSCLFSAKGFLLEAVTLGKSNGGLAFQQRRCRLNAFNLRSESSNETNLHTRRLPASP